MLGWSKIDICHGHLWSFSFTSNRPNIDEIPGSGKAGDEFSGLDNVMNSVLEAVAPRPSNIIPGTQTFEDLEAFLKRKKSEKLEELKKKL